MASTTEENNTNGDHVSSWAKVGNHVQLHGLVAAPHLNGRDGVLMSGKNQASGRYSIMLACPWKDPASGTLKHHPVALKPTNFRSIQSMQHGQRLRINMLPCNGCHYMFDRDKLSKCSKCKFTRYCSKKCQVSHWRLSSNSHKEDCPVLQEARKGANNLSRSDQLYTGMQQGCKLMSRGRFAQAEREFRQLLEKGFHFIGVYTNLGTCVLFLQRLDEAMTLFQVATTIPMHMGEEDEQAIIAAYTHLAQIMEKHKNDYEAAKDCYEQVLKIQPEHPEAIGGLLELKKNMTK